MSNLSSSRALLPLMSLIKSVARARAPFRPILNSLQSAVDALALLCDDQIAGESVASIGFQDAGSRKIAWLATNDDAPESVSSHLRLLINELSQLGRGVATPERVEVRLVALTLRRSQEKVEEYARRLGRRISKAGSVVQQTGNEALSSLWQVIQQTFAQCLQQPHGALVQLLQVCNTASTFRHNSWCEVLHRVAKSPGMDRIWSSVRHYIGRLGALKHAAQILVRFTRLRPGFFQTCDVGTVPQLSVSVERVQKGPPDLTVVLKQLLPDTPDLKQRLARLSGIERAELQAEFAKDWRHKIKHAHVHSEINALEFFHSRGFRFVNGDRYIGCSKPSCYYCDIYFTLHESRPVRRPCHSKAWMGWCLPSADGVAGSRFAAGNARFQGVVAGKMQQDVVAAMLEGLCVRSTMYDSTDAYTNSVRGN